MSDAPFVMPFGRHKGKRLDEIPAGYLTWVLDNVVELRPDTRAAIEAFINGPMATARGPAAARSPRSRPTRAAADESSPPGCSVCGLPGTPERPLVHQTCARDEVPF